MTKDELKPIDTSKYKITETGQVLKMTKDEMKDGMKDKISMALQDPILQMGFEVICSKLSRLEKENAELKRNLGLSIECEKAQKDGELCSGCGGDEDKPCEQRKNCKKCECG